jgi:hypothetical protein
MSQYKLSYSVAIPNRTADRVEKIANTEIELAAHILDMERDVGFICYDVQIEAGDFTEDCRSNNKLALQQIKRWATVLETAQHIN